MNSLFEVLTLPKSKTVMQAINRLVEAGVPLDKIAEGLKGMSTADQKILAIAQASHLIREKAISFNRLVIIYECAPDHFQIICRELQEIYEKSADRYIELTKANWDFLTYFLASHKTPKDFETLFIKSPKEFQKLKNKCGSIHKNHLNY